MEALDRLLRYLFGLSFRSRLVVSQELDRLVPESFRKLRYFLTWGEVGEIVADRFSIGSHTHRHHLSTELSTEDLRADIEDSLETLSNKGVIPSSVFCYPGGRFNEATQQVLTTLPFKAAVTVHRSSDRGKQPLLIGRTGMHEDISSTRSLF
ncbi:MAG: polysaccharide deacetylase family protein, partial [Deltaproteobacteria bacterium]|nr:polysaccharide deacetylase family protein [Deltaproteobacteria bacterium]